MNRIALAVALCSTFLLAACFPPATRTPIGNGQSAVDRSLTGTWLAKMEEADKGEDQAQFRFTLRGNGTMAVLITSLKKDAKDDDRIKAIITTAKVGDNRFINATLVSMGGDDADNSKDEMHGTLPLLYRAEGDTVVLYLMDEDKTKDAIKAGKIKGDIEPGAFGDAVITADRGALNTFVAGPEGLALFTAKFATLRRR